MKVNDSGMPEERYWNGLFNVPPIIDWLNVQQVSGPIVEVGCGYGTFTLPLAKKTTETIYSFDIEPAMIETTKRHLQREGISNVKLLQRDIVESGTELESGSVGMILLFNILHFNERRVLLDETNRVLKSFGVAAIIHWRKDVETPRGPAYSLRPDKQIILNSITGLDLSFNGNSKTLEPYHWGMQLIKGAKK